MKDSVARVKHPIDAIAIYRCSHWLYKHGFTLLSGMVYRINLMIFNCVIPQSCKIGKDTWLAHSVGIVLSPHCEIGDNVCICQNVTLGGGAIRVGKNCLIGANAVILGNITIGDNCKIGANTFVNFDVPAGSTVVGTKGRILPH